MRNSLRICGIPKPLSYVHKVACGLDIPLPARSPLSGWLVKGEGHVKDETTPKPLFLAAVKR